jgi:hypothetical protein
MQDAAAIESDPGLPLRRALRRRWWLPATAMLVGVAGCSGQIATLFAQGSGVEIKAELKRVWKRDKGAFVFVDFTITGTEKTIASADLECIVLHVGPLTSSATYIASIGGDLTDDYPAREGVVTANAYWHFEHTRDVPEPSLSSASIAIRENSDEPCFQFK